LDPEEKGEENGRKYPLLIISRAWESVVSSPSGIRAELQPKTVLLYNLIFADRLC